MSHQLLNKTFLLLSRFAAEPEDTDEWRLKKIIGVATAAAASTGYLGYASLYIAYNERLTGLLCIAASVLFVLGLISYGFFRHYALHWYGWSVTCFLTVTSGHVLLGGFVQSSMVLVWVLLIPVMTPVAYKPRHGLGWFAVAAAIFLVAALLEPVYLRAKNNIPSAVITLLFVVNTLGVASFMLLQLYYYVRQNEKLSTLLLHEQEKSDALLMNILPREITTILKNENRVIADHFDGVSILFADIVNFTPMSAKMSPAELVELLNEVFSYFDALVDKYGLEKIKTIGDCYMVAAGVPRQRSDHAHVLTRLALDMRDYTGQREFRGRRLVFRIGVNSGSAVAGVIGQKKFSYDLWGDDVNTASRMESHGTGGLIQVTEATYELIKDDFICEPRGTVSVKGKGEMKVWSVLTRKQDISPQGGVQAS